MLAKLTLDGLKAEIKELDARDTWLKLDLKNRNPDDGMTAIAYDKGYFLLRMLEEKIGREKWDSFLKTYFEKFAFKSMTTEDFTNYLDENLDVNGQKINFKEWIYASGLPANCPNVKTEELAKVSQSAKEFLAGTSPTAIAKNYGTKDWTTHHWNHFLRSFKSELTTDQMKQLDQQFQFTASGNSEITHDWLLHVIGSGYEPGYEKLESFLTGQGRRKFLQPLYAKLSETEKGTQMANRIYAEARSGYHAVSRQTIDQILEFQPDNNK